MATTKAAHWGEDRQPPPRMSALVDAPLSATTSAATRPAWRAPVDEARQARARTLEADLADAGASDSTDDEEKEEEEMAELKYDTMAATGKSARVRHILEELERTYREVQENTVLRQAAQFGPEGARHRMAAILISALAFLFCLAPVVLSLTPLGIPWLPSTFGTTFGVVLLSLCPLQLGVCVLLLYTKRLAITGAALLYAFLTWASVVYACVCAGYMLYAVFTDAGGMPTIGNLLGAVSMAVVCLILLVLQTLIMVFLDLMLRADTLRVYVRLGVGARMRKHGCFGLPLGHYRDAFASRDAILARDATRRALRRVAPASPVLTPAAVTQGYARV